MDNTEWNNDVNTSGTELPMVSLRLCGDGTRFSLSIPLCQRVLTYCAF
jgi:hypothetical protein